MNCYKCEVPLTEENASDEHIILNACGGRLTSKELLCNKCNSEFGNKFDRELAEATNDLANLLVIKRHNGEPQPISTTHKPTGEKYYIEYGGAPVQARSNYEIIPGENGLVRLSINAKNEREFKKTVLGLKRKYPALDADKILASAQKETIYLSEPLEINSHIGGEGSFKSITKTAINFYLHKGGQREYIKHLLPYLEDEIKLDVVWMHYPDVDIYKPQQGEVAHVLKVVGDSTEGILYAYVELFNIHCFIVRLNDAYTGVNLDEDYIFNVHTYEVKENQTNLKLTRSELKNLFENKNAEPFDKVKERYAHVIPIAYRKQDLHQINKIISKAVDNTIGAVPSGTLMTEELMIAMREQVVGGIMSFIAHRRREREIETNSQNS